MTGSPPTVAIVGRPNVGKSALFNRLAGRRIAIVHDQPGVTRDRLHATCTATARPCQIVDTGGIGANLDDGFAAQIRAEADIAIETADLIVLVVDGQEGLHPIDESLAAGLRRAAVPVALVVNKIDDPKHELQADEFSRLGLGDPLPVSAEHGRGFSALVDWLDARLPEAPPADAAAADAGRPLKLAIVGRPNVGKSSLVNAILGRPRTIVSEIAGTTRDAIDVPLRFNGRDYLLIDTAGLRPRSRRDTSVEVFSARRTETGIRRADLALLVVDAGQGVTANDRRIAKLVLDSGRPCLVVLNKFDLFHPEGRQKDRFDELSERVRRDLFFLDHVPFVAVSARDGTHLGKVFTALERVRQGAIQEVPTGPLNRLLQEGITRNPPPRNGSRRFKLLYATCATRKDEDGLPVPTFLLFINHADLLGKTYRRYLENLIRETYPFPGLPIHFVLKPRAKPEAD
jgi:GTPase